MTVFFSPWIGVFMLVFGCLVPAERGGEGTKPPEPDLVLNGQIATFERKARKGA